MASPRAPALRAQGWTIRRRCTRTEALGCAPVSDSARGAGVGPRRALTPPRRRRERSTSGQPRLATSGSRLRHPVRRSALLDAHRQRQVARVLPWARPPPAQRRGPTPPWIDAALVEQVQDVWARLRDCQIRTSKARGLRRLLLGPSVPPVAWPAVVLAQSRLVSAFHGTRCIIRRAVLDLPARQIHVHLGLVPVHAGDPLG